MREYVIKRLFQVIPTVLMITLVVFAMMQAIPGDPLMALLGDAYDEEDAELLRQEYGLDKPIVSQYLIWLTKLLQGDWGESFVSGRPVLQDVLIRLPVTAELIVLAMLVALVIAIPAGTIAALRQNTWGDYTAMSTALVGISIPDFFLGHPAAAGVLGGLQRAAAELRLGVPAGNLPQPDLRGQRLGQLQARHHAGDCPRGGPRGDPDAAAARQPAGDHPHGVRDHGARQRPGRRSWSFSSTR